MIKSTSVSGFRVFWQKNPIFRLDIRSMWKSYFSALVWKSTPALKWVQKSALYRSRVGKKQLIFNFQFSGKNSINLILQKFYILVYNVLFDFSSNGATILS